MKNYFKTYVMAILTICSTIHHLHAQSSVPILTINNETDTIRGIAVSDDGGVIATAAKDSELKVWDAKSGELMYTFTHREYVQGLVFIPNTQLLISAGVGGKIRVWNLDIGASEQLFETEYPKVQYLGFTPDGQTLITITSKGHRRIVELWNVESWKRVKKREEEVDFISFTPKGIIGIEFSVNPYKKRSGFVMIPALGWKKPGEIYRNDVQYWETASRRHTATSNGQIMATNLSPTEQILLYDLNQKSQLRKFDGAGQVYCLSFDSSGKRLISGSLDGVIRTWHIGTGKILSTFDVPEGHAVTSLVLNPSAKLMLAGDSSGKINIWKIEN